MLYIITVHNTLHATVANKQLSEFAFLQFFFNNYLLVVQCRTYNTTYISWSLSVAVIFEHSVVHSAVAKWRVVPVNVFFLRAKSQINSVFMTERWRQSSVRISD